MQRAKLNHLSKDEKLATFLNLYHLILLHGYAGKTVFYCAVLGRIRRFFQALSLFLSPCLSFS